MDLNSVRLFVAVAQAGSFSGAAKKTNIPVATVSRRISDLEQALQIRLMERSTRRLRLTDAGQTFYEYANRGIDELEMAKLALANQEKELSGDLRLSLPPNFTPWWPLLQKFHQTYPNIKIKVSISERKNDLIEDDIDVALRVGDVKHLSAIGRSLASYRHVLVASPAYLNNYGIPDIPEQLLERPLASWWYRTEQSVWILGNKEYPIEPYIEVNDFAQLRHLALNGNCITELPPFLAKHDIETGKLVEVLADYPFLTYELNLLYPSRKQLSRVVRTYVDFCLQEVAL